MAETISQWIALKGHKIFPKVSVMSSIDCETCIHFGAKLELLYWGELVGIHANGPSCRSTTNEWMYHSITVSFPPSLLSKQTNCHTRAITKLGFPQQPHYPIGVKRVHVNSPNAEGIIDLSVQALCMWKQSRIFTS